MHTPGYFERAGAEKLAVFIHGFMGGPNQFDDLAEAARQRGCSVLTVLLPGHGGSARDFARCTLEQWESHLQAELDKYKDRYSELVLVGHSMGGLLALNASAAQGNKVRGVLMLSPPIKLNFFAPRAFWSKLRLVTFPKAHEVRMSYARSNSVSARPLRYCLLWLAPVFQLYRLIGKTKRGLAGVCARVTIVHSKRDETVSFKSARILYDGLAAPKKALTLEKSWHAHYTKEEREKILDEMLEIIG